jgi:hypothetical protein
MMTFLLAFERVWRKEEEEEKKKKKNQRVFIQDKLWLAYYSFFFLFLSCWHRWVFFFVMHKVFLAIFLFFLNKSSFMFVSDYV